MNSLIYAAILAIISFMPVFAGPIDEIVLSEKQLKKIGAKVVCEVQKKNVSIQVEWKPAAGDPDSPQPRLDMFFSEDKQNWGDASLQVRFEKDAKGIIHADFTVSKARIDSVFLVFWGAAPEIVYHLSVRTVVDGYQLVDPFKTPEGEQGGTGNPAARSESKRESADKPQPESKGRSR